MFKLLGYSNDRSLVLASNLQGVIPKETKTRDLPWGPDYFKFTASSGWVTISANEAHSYFWPEKTLGQNDFALAVFESLEKILEALKEESVPA